MSTCCTCWCCCWVVWVARRHRTVPFALFNHHRRSFAVRQDRAVTHELLLLADELLAHALPTVELQLLAPERTVRASALANKLSSRSLALNASCSHTQTIRILYQHLP